MDFAWNAEQERMYAEALTFARTRLGRESNAGRPPGSHGLPRELWRRAAEYGFLGLSIPEEYGGLGMDAVTTSRIVEALGRGCTDMGLVFSIQAHLFACAMPVFEFGTPEQKQRYLPRLASGECVGANAITEAEAGSDVFALKLRAVRDGDEYVLSGVKSYVSNGPDADLFLVYGVTRPEHGYLGLSAFLVDRDRPGIRFGAPFRKMGLGSSSICSVYFEDCRVPVSSRLGPEGRGAAIFNQSMAWERACLFAGYVGAMDRLLEQCIQHARDRQQFGQPIGKNQAVSHRIVDMKLRLEGARLLLYRACWLKDQGKDATVEIALSKIAISEAAVQAGLDAIQIHGGMGFVEETGIEQVLRDAVPSTIFSGTSEVLRSLVAARLGL